MSLSFNPRNASALSSFVEGLDDVAGVEDKVTAIQKLDAIKVINAYNAQEPDQSKQCFLAEWDFMMSIAMRAKNRSVPFDWIIKKEVP